MLHKKENQFSGLFIVKGKHPDRMLPFVVRPSGFPLSGINLESAAHSKKTCLTAGFFVVRPSGFEPLAYRVGVCHSIQLSYGRIFSR